MCDCVETYYDETDRRTGNPTGKRVHIDPPPAGHNCEYVRKRNELIPQALIGCRGPKGVKSERYNANMERLAREAGLVPYLISCQSCAHVKGYAQEVPSYWHHSPECGATRP